MPTRISRVDSNQAEIVRGLRKAGVSVQHLHAQGHGCPDILAGAGGKNYLFEIKTDSTKKLTEDEVDWYFHWKGQVAVVWSLEQALKICKVKP